MMSKQIDISILITQVQEAAKRAAARFTAINLEAYWHRLEQIDQEDIWQKLADHPDTRWSGAVPVMEPASYQQAATAAPISIIGVDGSQIYADPEMVIRWAYVQAAAVRLQGEGFFLSDFMDIESILAGELERPELDWLFYPSLTSLTSFVDLWRTMLELDACVEAGHRYSDYLVLWDNPLLPLGVGVRSGLLRKLYGDRLMQMEGYTIAGLVSGPKSHLLANLITLAGVPGVEEALNFRTHVDDATLMRFGLPIGHRSAVFRYGSPFELKSGPPFPDIHFFFVRINEVEIVRVEVPEWIAADPDKVDIIHATVLKDSSALGYSLTLLTAHHTASINLQLSRELNLKAWSTYTQFGGKYYWPAKLQAKRG